MALVMPTRTDVPHSRFQVDLDGETYTLEVRWNTRAEAWFLTLGDADGDPLPGGSVKVVLDFPLTFRYRDARLPPGEFLAVDTTSRKEEAGLDELGARVLLLYVPVAELPAEFLV